MCMCEPTCPPPPRGRGAGTNLPNRFESLHFERDLPQQELKTTVLRDATRRIITRNDSPDIPFTYSINPYRGCEHGCVYCYARPTHEFLGFSAGLDFESKILAKENAAALLRKELSARSWEPATIAMSGVTDPYQPIESRLEITVAVCRFWLSTEIPWRSSPRTPWSYAILTFSPS